jgi:hypothetical protein
VAAGGGARRRCLEIAGRARYESAATKGLEVQRLWGLWRSGNNGGAGRAAAVVGLVVSGCGGGGGQVAAAVLLCGDFFLNQRFGLIKGLLGLSY